MRKGIYDIFVAGGFCLKQERRFAQPCIGSFEKAISYCNNNYMIDPYVINNYSLRTCVILSLLHLMYDSCMLIIKNK